MSRLTAILHLVHPSTTAQPPLQPQHPFYRLPSELILEIVDYLPPESFINFVFANYPLLRNYGLAPALSAGRVTYLTTQTMIPAMFPLLRMPPELMLRVINYLPPIDVMRFVVANYQDLARQGIAPSLSTETVKQLKKAVTLRMAFLTPPEIKPFSTEVTISKKLLTPRTDQAFDILVNIARPSTQVQNPTSSCVTSLTTPAAPLKNHQTSVELMHVADGSQANIAAIRTDMFNKNSNGPFNERKGSIERNRAAIDETPSSENSHPSSPATTASGHSAYSSIGSLADEYEKACGQQLPGSRCSSITPSESVPNIQNNVQLRASQPAAPQPVYYTVAPPQHFPVPIKLTLWREYFTGLGYLSREKSVKDVVLLSTSCDREWIAHAIAAVLIPTHFSKAAKRNFRWYAGARWSQDPTKRAERVRITPMNVAAVMAMLEKEENPRLEVAVYIVEEQAHETSKNKEGKRDDGERHQEERSVGVVKQNSGKRRSFREGLKAVRRALLESPQDRARIEASLQSSSREKERGPEV